MKPPTIQSTLLALASLVALNSSALAADPKKPAEDNSGKNERDRSGETKTPEDQSNTPEDIELARTIRKAVVADKSLTMTAKNVKIIAAGQQVTLRGPVNSAEEKTKIGELAQAAAGKANVDNQLEVKAAKTE